MANNDFSAESPQNYEQKSICCFVVDVSGSMQGEPINALNRGLQEFHREIGNNSTTANRLEVAIVEFTNSVEIRQNPALVSEFSMPILTANGTTALVDGVREATRLVENRKNWYKQTGQPYLRPWIILITDGEPDSNQDVFALANEIESDTKNKKYVFLPVGVEGANMHILQLISGFTQNENKDWVKMPPLKLDGLKFLDFFKWVSASMSVVARSEEGTKIKLPMPTDWSKGFEI